MFHTVAQRRRLFDTRQSQQGPALTSGADRTVAAGACGIPPTARALVLNLTGVGATGAGSLIAYPGAGVLPAASSIDFPPSLIRSNNTVVSLAADGTFALRPTVAGNGTLHLVIDVAGYFE